MNFPTSSATLITIIKQCWSVMKCIINPDLSISTDRYVIFSCGWLFLSVRRVSVAQSLSFIVIFNMFTWDCRGRFRRGKPSAWRYQSSCRGWRSAWSGRRTCQEPRSSSPDDCQRSCSGCWCLGTTAAHPSSSDAGTESWWNPTGGRESAVQRFIGYIKVVFVQ